MGLGRHEFERRIRKFNDNFRCKLVLVPKYDSGGKPIEPDANIEVWDKDGYGAPYVAISFHPNLLDAKRVEYVRRGHVNRLQGRQKQLVKERMAASQRQKEVAKNRRRIEAEAMADDFRPIVAKMADAVGVSKSQVITEIMEKKQLGFDDANKEYIRMQGEPA